jgi:hypothetical protein
MKEQIFNTPWGIARWVRLIVGLVLLGSLFYQYDTIMALLSGVLLFQAVFNVGCMGSACAAPTNKTKQALDDEVVEFEEIKE